MIGQRSTGQLVSPPSLPAASAAPPPPHDHDHLNSPAAFFSFFSSNIFRVFLITKLSFSLSSAAPQFEPNNRPYLTFLITSFSYSLTSFSFSHHTPIFNSHSHMSHLSFSNSHLFFSFSLVFVSDSALSSFWAAKGEPHVNNENKSMFQIYSNTLLKSRL